MPHKTSLVFLWTNYACELSCKGQFATGDEAPKAVPVLARPGIARQLRHLQFESLCQEFKCVNCSLRPYLGQRQTCFVFRCTSEALSRKS